jgi:hypothetical protein
MAAWRRAIELAIGEEDLAALGAIARSRTEPASRVERARMLLAYQEDPSFFKVGRAVGVHHQTAQRCVERALAFGPMAALDDRPRPGKEPTITAEAKAWVVGRSNWRSARRTVFVASEGWSTLELRWSSVAVMAIVQCRCKCWNKSRGESHECCDQVSVLHFGPSCAETAPRHAP